MAKYPIYLEMAGRRTVVIGGGMVAARKVQSLAEAGARVVVVSNQFHPTIEPAFNLPGVETIQSTYQKEYLTGATLCIAATNDRVLNERIYTDCQELEVLCNVVDQPDLCDFYVPAVVKRGDLQIAVSTDGNCPAYSGHIRRKLEEMFTEQHGHFVKELEKVRGRVIRDIQNPDERKALLGKLASDESFDYFTEHGIEKWNLHAVELIENVKT